MIKIAWFIIAYTGFVLTLIWAHSGVLGVDILPLLW